jgi:hypothetical protein
MSSFESLQSWLNNLLTVHNYACGVIVLAAVVLFLGGICYYYSKIKAPQEK